MNVFIAMAFVTAALVGCVRVPSPPEDHLMTHNMGGVDSSLKKASDPSSAMALAYATRHYGVKFDYEQAVRRRALVVTYQRDSFLGGELSYLLYGEKVLSVWNLYIVQLVKAPRNRARVEKVSAAEFELLFSERTFNDLKRWPVGRYSFLKAADAFAEKSDDTSEVWNRMLPIISRHCLIDNFGWGREKEWSTASYRIEPIHVMDHQFKNVDARGGFMQVSVYTDELSLPIGVAVIQEFFVH